MSKTTSKQRAYRVALDHYKSWDTLTTVKWMLTGLATVICLGAVAWALATNRGSHGFSHGPISQSHARWESDCSACHDPQTPLKQGTVTFVSSATDKLHRCQACHVVSNHYRTAADADQACAECHREHQGANADLLDVSDRSCTNCHADLTGMVASINSDTFAQVTAFPGDHPPFRSLKSANEAGDPGNLKFTHSRHMRLGLTSSTDSRESDRKTYADFSPEMRGRYQQAGENDDDLVQLQCISCHVPAVRKGSTNATASELGDFAAVSFEQHCRACHPLYASADVREVLPHGLSGNEMENALKRLYRSQWFEDADEQTSGELRQPVPGRSRLLSQRKQSALRQIDEQILSAREYVKAECSECHDFSEGLQVRPTNVPNVWLPKSHFDHYAHRAVSCQECHAAAYASTSTPSVLAGKQESNRVMIPDIASCAKCHAPHEGDTGGIAHNCTLCHRYHHGDSPASVLPDAGATISIDAFLKGGRDATSRE